jgi:hypothetical protein
MHTRRFKLSLLILAFVAVLAVAKHSDVARAAFIDDGTSAGASRTLDLTKRDGHGHNHDHAPPLLEINETDVTMYHAPTPPSYWSIDIDGIDPSVTRHPGLMMLHGVFMSLAFFVALPMSA